MGGASTHEVIVFASFLTMQTEGGNSSFQTFKLRWHSAAQYSKLKVMIKPAISLRTRAGVTVINESRKYNWN